MTRVSLLFAVVFATFRIFLGSSASFRPPAVPLIVQDPYISIWSPADNLFETDTIHWTGDPISFFGMLIIDGKCFRWMGSDQFNNCPNSVSQTSLTVLPLTTSYRFTADSIQFNVNFTSPAGFPLVSFSPRRPYHIHKKNSYRRRWKEPFRRYSMAKLLHYLSNLWNLFFARRKSANWCIFRRKRAIINE